MTKRPIFYANASDPVGKVRVYRCPACDDGQKIATLQERIKIADEALRWFVGRTGARLHERNRVASRALAEIRKPL